MRVLSRPAVAAILLFADQSAWAQSSRAGCVVNPGTIWADRVATRELRVRAGHSCRLYLYSYAGFHMTVHAVHIIVPPAHGTLRTWERTGGGTVAFTVTYVAARGFVGHDRFEVIYQWTEFVRPISAVYKAEVTVTP
jgi:hypothetical protein